MRREYKLSMGTLDIYCYGLTRREAYDTLEQGTRDKVDIERLQLTDYIDKSDVVWERELESEIRKCEGNLESEIKRSGEDLE